MLLRFRAKEGGYSCFVDEVLAAISQGETLEGAKLVLACQREFAEKPEILRP